MGTGAHLDGVSFPHLPEIIEPGLLWEERERERGVRWRLGDQWGQAQESPVLTSTMTAMPAMKAIR